MRLFLCLFCVTKILLFSFVFLLIIWNFSFNGECRKCDLGWVFFDGLCVEINNKNVGNWSYAYASCDSKFAKLLSIDSFSYPITFFKIFRNFNIYKKIWVNKYYCKLKWKITKIVFKLLHKKVDGFISDDNSQWVRSDGSIIKMGAWYKILNLNFICL